MRAPQERDILRHTHNTHKALVTLLLIAAILAILGLIFIYSASSVFALERCKNAHYFVIKQAGGLLVALACIVSISHIPSTLLKSYAPLGLCITWCAVLIPLISPYARTVHGSTRWLSICGITLQPVEFLKVFLIPTISTCISLSSPHQSTRKYPYFIMLGIIIAACLIALLAQPDFGQSVLIIATTIIMLLLASPAIRYIGYLMGISVITIICLILTRPYRLQRLLSFLSPWNDPHGSGFQIVQSLIAIGSGGTTGLGIGNSQQKFFYLPMQHTDFIFSIIGEETGFLGTMTLLLLYTLLAYQGCKLAWYATRLDNFLIFAGYTSMISIQAGINLAVATGLIPTKGIGLPFMSFGLSSLIAQGCILGIIRACTKNIDS